MQALRVSSVEHVHVNSGGQAIVGVVHSPELNKLMPYEQLPYAPDTPLRSDPERDAGADRRRCAENGAVGCMAGPREAVRPSAIRTPSAGYYSAKAIAERRALQRLREAELDRACDAPIAIRAAGSATVLETAPPAVVTGILFPGDPRKAPRYYVLEILRTAQNKLGDPEPATSRVVIVSTLRARVAGRLGYAGTPSKADLYRRRTMPAVCAPLIP